jgi:glycosyltransferase involved in cell wall biosynthesis
MQTARQKKILVIAPYFYPKIGGVEGHILNLYSGIMATKKYEIIIVTTKYNSDVQDLEVYEGFKIYRLPYQYKISNTPISFKWKSQIQQIIEQEKPNILMVHSPVPFLADLVILTNKNIPIILKYHSGSMKKEKGLLINYILSMYEKLVLPVVISKVDYLICSSDYIRDVFLKQFKFKSKTITPGVNTEKFKPRHPFGNKAKNILYVGRIDRTSTWKGLKYLIDSFVLVSNNIPESRLSIVGDGDDLENQIQYTKKLNIFDKVDFLGSLQGKDLIKRYQQSSLLVLPSITESESFGMVLIEAMACKLPVIGSDIGGIPYVIDHEKNGLLVPPKDSRSLSIAISRILHNPALATKMGTNGYNKVKSVFTWDKKINETINVIEKVLNNTDYEIN